MPDLPRTYIPGSTSGGNSVVISNGNSSGTPLAAGQSFTGSGELAPANHVAVVVSASHDGTYQVQVSLDNTNWVTIGNYDYRAGGVNRPHIFITFRRYVRVVFNNTSGAAQTSFSIVTYFGDNMGVLNVPSNGIISHDADTTVTLALTEEVAHARGQIDGVFLVNKFGENGAIDTATVPEDIWDGGGVYTGFPTQLETVSIVSGSGADSATGAGASAIRIEGLDANYDLQSETVLLTGVTPANTVNEYRRVFRAYVTALGTGASPGASNAGILTIRHTTTTANVFSVIAAGDGQSRVAVYTVPRGYTAYMRSWAASLRDNTTNNAQVAFWTRKIGGPVRLQRPFHTSTTVEGKREIYGGVSFEELTDIAMRVTAIQNNGGDIDGEFQLIVTRN